MLAALRGVQAMNYSPALKLALPQRKGQRKKERHTTDVICLKDDRPEEEGKTAPERHPRSWLLTEAVLGNRRAFTLCLLSPLGTGLPPRAARSIMALG